MAFVPGLSHDLFLSYAHTDDPAWIEGFEAGLRVGLRDRLGQDVAMWQDVKQLRLGQVWPAEIEEVLDRTAAFVAVVSPGYLKSVWCQRERRRFLEASGAEAVARAERFLKVIKAPADNHAEKSLLPNIQHLSFFRETDDQTGSAGFVPGTDDFRIRMRETVYAIAALLRSMRRRHEPVFVATPADDGLTEWEALRGELQAQGFDVRPEGPLDPSFDDDLLTRELDPAVLAVFLLTGTHDAFVARQLALARNLSKRLLFWLHPSVASAGADQSTFIQSIRRGEGLAASATLLERMSSRDMIREVLEVLKPRRLPEPLAPNEKARVYLLYDPTTERDGQVAMRIRDAVQSEPLEVFVPQGGAAAADRLERHRQLLRECDGVLLCRSAAPAPDQWLFQTVPDVLFAEQQLNRPPMRSKAFLLGEPEAFRGLPNVIPLVDPMPAQNLESFLQPLRQARSASAAV